MQKKHLFIGLGSVVLVAAVNLWPTTDKAPTIIPVMTPTSPTPTPTPPNVEVLAPTKPVTQESPNLMTASPISKELKWVATSHRQVLQYPAYSQPIVSEDSPYLNWNKFESVAIPMVDGSITASLNINKYRHFYPEIITVTLQSSHPVIDAQLDVISVGSQQVLTTLPSGNQQWQITPDKEWPEELRVVARVGFDLGEDIISADFRLYHSVASVLRVLALQSNGPDMLIPVVLDIKKTGIYRLRANLYHADGRALASLVAKKRLSAGEQVLNLKAFKKVLPANANDLALGDVMIERMSGFPGEKSQYGHSQQQRYSLGSFNSDTLSDEAYQMSDQEKQQLKFLQQASQSG